jgi:multidrug efflux system membrane fusion protein
MNWKCITFRKDSVTENRVTFRNGILLSALMSVFILVEFGCGKPAGQAGMPQMPPPLVTITNAVSQDVPVYLDEIGKNYASESVTLMPQVAGRIVERDFADGADLRKDQLLFVIDPRPFKAQLDAAEAQLAQDKAALDLANTQLKMYAAVADSRAVSQFDFETRKNTVEVDKAQVQAGEAAVEAAKLNLEYCYIHSPIDGRAGARLVDTGNVVQANTTGLLSIQRLDPIYVDFTITERDLTDVRREMSRGSLKALVRIPSNAETAARKGNLTFLDNSVQNATGTVFLRATVPNSDHHFWPGLFVDVKLVLETKKAAVLVPNQATQISQKGPFVYVLKQDDTVELRPVTLGQIQGENVVITNGVAAGERVVVTGQMTIGPGAKVRTNAGGPGGPPASAPAPGAAGSGKS